MSFENGLRALFGLPKIKNDVTFAGANIITGGGSGDWKTAEEKTAMTLSAVDRCIEVLSDSIGKLPVYVINRNTKERVDHPLMQLLTVRPNSVQSPMVCKKMLEGNRLCGGNGYAYIERDPVTMKPIGIVPIPHGSVSVIMDKKSGTVFYTFQHPFTGKGMTKVPAMNMIHVMGYTYNGYTGVSVLSRAADVIGTSRAAQQYSLSYYSNGGQPSGVLQTDTDIGGTVDIQRDGRTVKVSKKDLIREEWEKKYSGPNNANRIAVLDMGLKYSPISVSNADAQFIEQMDLSVQDIARYFGVPLYKLQAGKQSYSSNEQNAIEYVVGTLHPIVEQYEQELTFKLLTASEVESGLEIHLNMLAELKGDASSRSNWYRAMREIGVFSPNDICALEDLPMVEGGETRYASLNYVPLKDFEELSRARNIGTGGSKE